MLIEKVCPFCSKKSSIFVSDDAWAKYESGVNIRSALAELDDFGREVVITGMCFNCQEKTFHRPLKEHAAKWGEDLGECPNCGTPVYSIVDKTEQGHYRCGGCYMPIKVDETTGELTELTEDPQDTLS